MGFFASMDWVVWNSNRDKLMTILLLLGKHLFIKATYRIINQVWRNPGIFNVTISCNIYFSFIYFPTVFTPGSYFNVLKSSTVGFRTIAVTRAIKLTQIIMHKKWIYLNYFPFFSIFVRLLLFNVAISRCLLNFCVKFNYSQIRVFVQH